MSMANPPPKLSSSSRPIAKSAKCPGDGEALQSRWTGSLATCTNSQTCAAHDVVSDEPRGDSDQTGEMDTFLTSHDWPDLSHGLVEL